MTEQPPSPAAQTGQSLTVVIPSRTQPRQVEFLRRAVASIKSQTIYSVMTIKIVVSIDQGESLPTGLADEMAFLVVASHGRSQAAALNAGLGVLDTALVAILEDDDRWFPRFLETALKTLSIGAGFVSSTQLEVDEDNVILRINDFPTPSGWLMPVSTMRAVGKFDESHRWHLDNEWLGRLAETKIARVHLAEATAPIGYDVMSKVRPWLASVIQFGGPKSRIARHDMPIPLIQRLAHGRSGLSQIQQRGEAKVESEKELQRLIARFGHVPW